MTSFRILHVDDENDIREVVALSLNLDPQFTTRSCASGEQAIVEAAAWSPDLILCDVVMPDMDGPATLARLRENPRTAKTPVVFMTACQQARELERLKSLGATGVIAKPFDPTTLAGDVRGHLWSAKMASVADGFRDRLRADAATVTRCRAALTNDAKSSTVLDELHSCAHKLAGAAGIFGAKRVSWAASVLEESVAERRAGSGPPRSVEEDVDALLECIARV